MFLYFDRLKTFIMKKLLSLLLLYCITSHAQKTAPKMDGVYAMTKQIVNNGYTDQIIPTKQLKMYHGRYVVYAAQISPTDSMASFGIGTYHVENGKVIENFSTRRLRGQRWIRLSLLLINHLRDTNRL